MEQERQKRHDLFQTCKVEHIQLPLASEEDGVAPMDVDVEGSSQSSGLLAIVCATEKFIPCSSGLTSQSSSLALRELYEKEDTVEVDFSSLPASYKKVPTVKLLMRKW